MSGSQETLEKLETLEAAGAAGPVGDSAARRRALLERDRGVLVEAGAGSGKTAILAGRVALLLADGVKPRNIAAITFTELAAAELAARVGEYVDELASGRVPVTIGAAFEVGGGPSAEQREALKAAHSSLDELTCTTIHGFARELARPYPVEANIDPGAYVIDGSEQKRLFELTLEEWLHELLGEELAEGPLCERGAFARLVAAGGIDSKELLKLARLVLEQPQASGPVDAPSMSGALRALRVAARDFLESLAGVPSSMLTETNPPTSTVAALKRSLTNTGDDLEDALALLCMDRDPPFFTLTGTPRKRFDGKGKWQGLASAEGMSQAAAGELFDMVKRHHGDVITAFEVANAAAVDALLTASVITLKEAVERYQQVKRESAALDFDDLIRVALTLLREHPEVRSELAERYQHVLIDEFQDTDPEQAEIVWRLTGEPDSGDWRGWRTRGGSRFVVGDPKQSIYRFRGADARTYAALANSMESGAAITLNLNTNFRSRPALVDVVNQTFAEPLSEAEQPGYQPLAAWVKQGGPAVRRLLVSYPDPTEAGAEESPSGGREARIKADEMRAAEADLVADLVLTFISVEENALGRRLSPSEIALLAPSGSGLEFYERALEARGISVASQAGKGFYRRQEVQDLVALTRALADPNDTVALGALLTGPLVGVTLEELLDAGYALSKTEAGRLTLNTGPELLPAGPIKEALLLLKPLFAKRLLASPHALLSEAVDALEVRAVLAHRHGVRAGRALRNLERFLESSRAYAMLGLSAFAQDVKAAWADQESELEGRADSSEQAVTLITVHSAKGLEWPVVIPVNMVSRVVSQSGVLHCRVSGQVAARLFGASCSAYERIRESEETELQAERVRLWYVAATRARDLLVLPQHEEAVKETAWCHVITTFPDDLPSITPSPVAPTASAPGEAVVVQSREEFLREEERIAASLTRLTRRAPSRREEAEEEQAESGEQEVPSEVSTPDPARAEAAASALLAGFEEPGEDPGAHEAVWQVGALRGILLHKLMEELINQEVESSAEALKARASELVEQLGVEHAELDASEVALTALNAWSLPEVADLHGRLVAEVDVAGAESLTGGERVLWSGVADAVAVSKSGAPEVVVDWKSDRSVTNETLAHYEEQLHAYLRLTGAAEGLLVFATTEKVVRIMAEAAPESERALGARQK